MNISMYMRRALVRQLRTIAAAVFNNNIDEVLLPYGICYAILYGITSPHNNRLIVVPVGGSRWDMNNLFHNVLYHDLGFQGPYLAPAGSCWHQRAMFCLLMAEYLEDKDVT